MTTKTKTTKPATKAPAKPVRQKGFWDITAGSRKEEIARALSAKGKDYAVAKAIELGLGKATAISWIRFWVKAGKIAAEPKANRQTKQTAKPKRDVKSSQDHSASVA